jgi:hypothetical protein
MYLNFIFHSLQAAGNHLRRYDPEIPTAKLSGSLPRRQAGIPLSIHTSLSADGLFSSSVIDLTGTACPKGKFF